MAWDSTIVTIDEMRDYIGNPTLSDALLEDAANAADAAIIDYHGAHPVDGEEDTPAQSAQKTRDRARRKQAVFALALLENLEREQNNPTFKGVRMSVENLTQRRTAAIRKAGAVANW